MVTILLKKVAPVVILVAVVGIYIREDVIDIYRLYEKYNDVPSSLKLESYHAVIQARQVDGVQNNLSGLTWSAEHNMLFAVINNPSELIWMTTEGKLVGRLNLSNISDPEAIEWAGKDKFWVGSEKDSSASLVNLDIHNNSYHVISKIKFDDYTQHKNKGLEGLAWDKGNCTLFAAKEKKPVVISKVQVLTEDIDSERFVFPDIAFVNDVSGLHYYNPKYSLLVLSDESKKVVEINTKTGQVQDRLYLNAGWSGLKEDIPQAEGITLDGNGDLYIVSEPNLFYRFSKY